MPRNPSPIEGIKLLRPPSGQPGCLLQALLLGIVCIAGGVYLMQGWEALSAASRVGAIMLTVCGTLLLLPWLLMFILGLVVRHYFRRVTDELQKAGEQMVAQNKAMFGAIHEFRDASADDFASLDRRVYDDATAELTAEGWRHLGDVVDATIAGLGQPSPVIRILTSPDGTTMLGVYQLKVPQVTQKLGRDDTLLCNLSSEFDDGEFVTTANTEGLNLMTAPPQLHHRQCSPHTSRQQLIQQHETEKQKLLAAKPGTACVRISTLREALESEKRQEAIKAAFRRDIGYVDPEEVRRIADDVEDEVDSDLGDLAADATDRARRRREE